MLLAQTESERMEEKSLVCAAVCSYGAEHAASHDAAR